jgi:hypothetical protein
MRYPANSPNGLSRNLFAGLPYSGRIVTSGRTNGNQPIGVIDYLGGNIVSRQHDFDDRIHNRGFPPEAAGHSEIISVTTQ